MRWMIALLSIALLALVIACNANSDETPYSPDATVTGSPTRLFPTATSPAAQERATLLGALSIDGEPLEADYLGANVIHDGGLINACQVTLPAVRGGRYEIDIKSDAETKGCGAPGSQVVLWTSLGDGIIFSSESLAWPGRGQSAFDASFSRSDPQGARPSSTEFYGHVRNRDGTPLTVNTVVQAFVGETLCGLGTVYDYSGDLGFVLIVSGPERAGCEKDGTINFRVGDAQATEPATNDLAGGSENRDLQLTLSN